MWWSEHPECIWVCTVVVHLCGYVASSHYFHVHREKGEGERGGGGLTSTNERRSFFCLVLLVICTTSILSVRVSPPRASLHPLPPLGECENEKNSEPGQTSLPLPFPGFCVRLFRDYSSFFFFLSLSLFFFFTPFHVPFHQPPPTQPRLLSMWQNSQTLLKSKLDKWKLFLRGGGR